MLKKLLSISVAAGLLAGCSLSGSGAADQAAVLAPTKIIRQVPAAATTEAKVQDYLGSAQAAQARLEVRLNYTTGALRGGIDIPFELVPSVYAQEAESEVAADSAVAAESEASTDAAEISQLIAEIDAYTELAIEAAESETDPAAIQDLLESIQETQTATAEILSGAPETLEPEVAAVIDQAQAAAAESIETVDTVAAEVADAVDAGTPSLAIDVPTDVEAVLASQPAGAIQIERLTDPKARAELRIAHAKSKLATIQSELTAKGVAEADAATILQFLTDRITAAESAVAAGAGVREALGQLDAAERNVAHIRLIAERAQDAAARAAELQTRAESGDPVAVEQLAKIQEFAEQKPLAERLAARQEVVGEIRAELQTERDSARELRQATREQLRDATQALAQGELAPEQFQAKKDEIITASKIATEQRAEFRAELRDQRREQLQALTGLPQAEIEQKKAEIDANLKTRREQFSQTQQGFVEAIRNSEARPAEAAQQIREQARAELDTQREQVRADFDAKVEAAIQAMPETDQAAAREKFEAAKAERETRDAERAQVREQRDQAAAANLSIHAENADLREQRSDALGAGDQAAAAEITEKMQENRQEIRENAAGVRREDRQGIAVGEPNPAQPREELRQEARENIQTGLKIRQQQDQVQSEKPAAETRLNQEARLQIQQQRQEQVQPRPQQPEQKQPQPVQPRQLESDLLRAQPQPGSVEIEQGAFGRENGGLELRLPDQFRQQ